MKRILAFGLLAYLIGSLAAQTVPTFLPFQGRLLDQFGKPIPDGQRVVKFQIFGDPTGSSILWAGEVHQVTINGGLVNVMLGSKNSLPTDNPNQPGKSFFDQPLFLQVTSDANNDSQITAADPPLLPRQAILPVVFAKDSGNARKLQGHDWSDIFGVNAPVKGFLDGSRIASNSITLEQFSARKVASDASTGGLALSASNGEFTVVADHDTGTEPTAVDWTSIPNLQISISTVGRPVLVGLTGNTEGLRTALNLNDDDQGNGGALTHWGVFNEAGVLVFRYDQLVRAAPQKDTTGVSNYAPVSSVFFVDIPPRGRHSYRVSVQPKQIKQEGWSAVEGV